MTIVEFKTSVVFHRNVPPEYENAVNGGADGVIEGVILGVTVKLGVGV
jgi:hypothetical protein